MSSVLGQAALYGGIGAVVGILGGVLGTVARPGDALQSTIQHFAAGVVLAGAALELLPEARELGEVGAIVGGFAAGGLAMAGLKALTSRLEARETPGSIGLVVATGVDVFVDGLVVGASFAAGSTTGALVAIALSIELFFLSLATVREVGDGAGGRRALAVTAGIASMLAVGAVVGAAVFSGAGSDVLAVALAFAAAVLIYLPTEELLGEAHALRDTSVGTLALFAGFGLFLAIDLAA